MITATLPRYFSSGPNKLENGVPKEYENKCDKYWWHNLLYVNNLFIAEPDVGSVVNN